MRQNILKMLYCIENENKNTEWNAHVSTVIRFLITTFCVSVLDFS